MSIPHDYDRHGFPELRSRGNSRHYIEPDYIANEADDQLPLISTIGRGPRGAGLSIGNVVNKDGEFSFGIYSDLTGELVQQTPNLSAGVISISSKPADPVAGDTVAMDIDVQTGSEHRHYTVPIPSGAVGSRIFMASTELEDGGHGHAYRVQVSDLMVYGRNSAEWQTMPVPRVNDVVVFKADGKLGFGTIEAVESGQVVFTSQVLFDVLQHLTIGENGHWYIDGEDTGTMAQGAPGKDGEPAKVKAARTDGGVKVIATDVEGTTEAVVKDGADGFSPTIVSTDTDTGVRLEITDKTGSSTVDIDDGTDGEDGLPATMVVRSVTETEHPTVTVQRTDAQTNTFSMDFGLPRGADGKSIDIQGGVYTVDQLPSYDDTPVNRAFIVKDSDSQFDLYIRGIEPVIAEDGGPWTVVEDWQGYPGFSIRYVHGNEIDQETPLEVSEADIESTFAPSAHILDGDLVIDDRMRLGVIGSASDNNGIVTVTYVTKLQIGWDDILDKPDDLVHTDDLTAAIAAEADAREKADQLLETEIDGKLDAADLVAGSNVSISESGDGKLTISATGGGGGGGGTLDIDDATHVLTKNGADVDNVYLRSGNAYKGMFDVASGVDSSHVIGAFYNNRDRSALESEAMSSLSIQSDDEGPYLTQIGMQLKHPESDLKSSFSISIDEDSLIKWSVEDDNEVIMNLPMFCNQADFNDYLGIQSDIEG